MEARKLLAAYGKSGQAEALNKWCKKPEEKVLHLEGLAGSYPALIAASCLTESNNPQAFILPDRETAAYFYNDLVSLIPSLKVHFFPSSYKRSVQYSRESKDNLVRRTETLQEVRDNSGPMAIVTFPEAIVEKIVSGDYFDKNSKYNHWSS